MNYDAQEIYTLKLVTGEELVTKILKDNTDSFEADQPISTMITAQGLQLVPSLFSADQEHSVTINKSAVVMVSEPRQDVRASYIQATTGIVSVKKQIITG